MQAKLYQMVLVFTSIHIIKFNNFMRVSYIQYGETTSGILRRWVELLIRISLESNKYLKLKNIYVSI